MDGEAFLYMCPCYKLFQSLEEVLVHQLTCQTAKNTTAPSPAEAEAAELYANAPFGQPPPAGPVHSGPDSHHPALDSPVAIVPDQASGQHCPQALLPGSKAAVAAAKPNGLMVGMGPPLRKAQRPAGSSSTPAAAPLIRYQCGECGLLFESLPLWQQHHKLGLCGQLAGKEPQTAGKCEEGEGEQREEDGSQNVSMAEPKMKVERMEEGDAEGLEVSEHGEKLSTFDHSYQVKEMGVDGSSKDKEITEGRSQTVAAPEFSTERKLSSEESTATTKTDIATKSGAELNPTTPDPQMSFPSEETSPDRNFLCVFCGAALGSLEALSSHRKARHGLEGALHCCQFCGKEFMNTTLFLYHQRQHRQQGSAQPSEVTPARAELPGQGTTTHIESETEREEAEEGDSLPTPLPDGCPSATVEPCPHCGQTFKRRCHLRAHLQCHSVHKPHRCDLCPKAFAYKSNLGRHRHTHGADTAAGSGERPHVCQRCGRGFTQVGSLRQHTLFHERQDARQTGGGEEEDGGKEEELPYTCGICLAAFRTPIQLRVHCYKHSRTYPFSCSVCGQSFQRKKKLELHALIHQGKQPLSCPRCPELFLIQSELDDHLTICPRKTYPAARDGSDNATAEGDGGAGRCVRRRRQGQLTCDLCGHRCVTQQGLDLHRLSHAGLTPLRCPHPPCRQRFASNAALLEHLLVHEASGAISVPDSKGNDGTTKPRPYRCKDCGKGFTTASSLSVHLRIHTGERPFQCSQCSKRFRQIPHLRDHERLHSDERPFVCSVCGRSFVLAARLAEHARTHSGDKPYSCPLCDRTFRSLSNLGKHRKTHAQASTVPAAARSFALSSKLAHPTGTASEAVVEVAEGKAQALVLPAVGEGQAAVHTILLLHSQPGSPPQFATLPLGETAVAPSSSSSPTPSPSAPLVLMHPSVALGDGHPRQLGPVVSHAIEVIVTETGE